jgi:beta-N-acetylhexosaminidase
MTAHVVFSEIDRENPATLSGPVIDTIIRKRIGFDGALMTDDISMGALSGGFRERGGRPSGRAATWSCIDNGELAEASEIAAGVPELEGEALRRTDAAWPTTAAGAGGPARP